MNTSPTQTINIAAQQVMTVMQVQFLVSVIPSMMGFLWSHKDEIKEKASFWKV